MATEAKASRFVWFDLQTSDPEAAKTFYSSLFGWTIDDSPHYHHIQSGGRHIGGLMKLDAPGVRPHWVGYVGTDDLDGAMARVKRGGGEVVTGPIELQEGGRFFLARDPQGAIFAGYSSPRWDKDADRDRAHGEFCWHELETNDTDGAARFYGESWGWTAQAIPEMGYTLFQHHGRELAGMMKMKGAPHPLWLHFVHAPVDEATKRAQSLGARLLVEPQDAGEHGRFSLLLDPQGAAFGLYQAPKK